MEVARLQVAFEATGQGAVQSAVRKTDSDIKNLANNSVGSASRIGSAFSNAGKAIAIGFGVVAAAGIANGVKGLLMANANAEQLKVQLDIATGSAERATLVYNELQKVAAQTPFEFPELVSASARIESFGQDSLAVLDTIGDTAAGTGRTVEQVTNAYLDAGMGQYVRLQELGIDAMTVGDKVVLSYVKNGETIRKEVDKNNGQLVQSTVEAIWNERYEGAMAKQSKTFLGQWSTLKDNVNLTMQEMTKGFFNWAKNGLNATNRFFNRFNAKRAQGFSMWEAGLRSLHTTLNQVFGPAAGGAIIGVIRGIGSAVSTVIDITGGLIEAFGTGRGVAAIFRDLPAPIRGVAEALGSIADAVGDVVRGFQSGGIGEMLSRLREEARQIALAGIDIGVIAVKAVFELGKDVVTNVWDWFKAQLGLGQNPLAGIPVVGAAAGGSGAYEVSFGTVLVTAALKLGGQIAEWAGNLWGWVKGQVGAGGTEFTGVGAGSPMGNTISVGDVLIDGVAKLGASLSSLAGNLSGWIQSKFPNGMTGDSIEVNIAQISVGVLNAVSDVTAADVSGWIQTRIDLLTGVSAELKEWKIILFGPDKVEAGPGAQEETKSKVQRIVDGYDWVNAKMKWIAEMDPSPKIEMNPQQNMSDLSAFLQRWADGQETIKVPFTNWEIAVPAWRDIKWDAGFGGEGNFITAIYDWVKGQLTGDFTVPLPDWNLDLGVPKIKFGGLFGMSGLDILSEIGKKLNNISVPLPDWDLKLGIPDIDDIPGSQVIEWIKEKLPDSVSVPFTDWKLDLSGGGGADGDIPPSSSPNYHKGPPQPSSQPGTVGGETVTTLPNVGTGSAPPPIKVPAPDLTAFNAAWATVPTTIGTAMSTGLGAASTYATAIGTVVGTQIGTMVGNVTALLSALVSSVTAQFGAMVASSSSSAQGMSANVSGSFMQMVGSVSAAMSAFVSVVASGFNQAMAYGQAWNGQVFTARFSIDTSGLTNAVAIARQAAADIAAVMPHSPAKEGPLREPITFDYIADNMRTSMDRLTGYALSGMSAVRGSMGLSGPSLSPSYSVPPMSRTRNTQARTGDTYIIQGDLLEPREWQNRVRTLAAEGAVTVVDRRLATSRVAGR